MHGEAATDRVAEVVGLGVGVGEEGTSSWIACSLFPRRRRIEKGSY